MTGIIPPSRPWIAAFLAVASLAGLACGSGALAVDDKPPANAAAESFSKTLSKSPDGKYALVLRGIPDPEDDITNPRARHDEWGSLFLVQAEPFAVITEIDRGLRVSRMHQGEEYGCFWQADSSRFAVVFSYRHDSALAVFQNRQSEWKRITLPDLDWVSAFRSLAKSHRLEEGTMKSSIDSVSFKKGDIVVSLSGTMEGGTSPAADVTMRYRYTESKSGWKGRVDAISLAKE